MEPLLAPARSPSPSHSHSPAASATPALGSRCSATTSAPSPRPQDTTPETPALHSSWSASTIAPSLPPTPAPALRSRRSSSTLSSIHSAHALVAYDLTPNHPVRTRTRRTQQRDLRPPPARSVLAAAPDAVLRFRICTVGRVTRVARACPCAAADGCEHTKPRTLRGVHDTEQPEASRIERLECQPVVVLQRQLGVGAQQVQRGEHWAAAEADSRGDFLAVAQTRLSIHAGSRLPRRMFCIHVFRYRAPSTLRHRKGGMFMLLNDGITGGPAFDLNEASDKAALADDELTQRYYDCEDQNSTRLCFLVSRSSCPCSSGDCVPRLGLCFRFRHTTPPNPVSPNALSRTVSPFSAVPISAHLLVAIFPGCIRRRRLFVLLPLGALLTAACVSEFVGAWSDFSVKDGEDSWEADLGEGDGDVR
ncbi:hypothetical protein B0H19DRAFT_1374716 [Mycena capillaripes]|nr:hypothetical protein B0H19DRAFT_1374716 [Mycena capillaripes]